MLDHYCWGVECAMPANMPGTGSCSGSLQTLSISLAVYFWGRKELSHGFSGHGLFAEMENGFWKDDRAAVLTLWKKSPLPHIKAQPSLLLLELQLLWLACSMCFGSGRSANACWLASLGFNLTDMEDCLERSSCSKVNPPVDKEAIP